jgi:hypothetical protein
MTSVYSCTLLDSLIHCSAMENSSAFAKFV